jgi:hypothetical protein
MLGMKKAEQSKLMRLEAMETAAHQFGLFKTGNKIKGIQEGLVDLDGQKDKSGNAREVLKLVDKTEIEFASEYDDQKPGYKKKAVAGNVVLFGLLGAMGGDIALILLRQDIMESMPGWIGQNLQKTIVAVAACIAIYPARCLYKDYKLEKMKEDIGTLLSEIKSDLTKVAGNGAESRGPAPEPPEDLSGWF